MPQNEASDLGLLCLPLVQLFLNRLTVSVIFKALDKHGEEIKCPHSLGQYSMITRAPPSIIRPWQVIRCSTHEGCSK